MREKRHAARRAARTAVTSRFVVLTGLSGSGKSQAIRALEDLGYFCVDNLPVTLLPMLAELTLRAGTEISRAAVVVDVREGKMLKEFPRVYRRLKTPQEPEPGADFPRSRRADARPPVQRDAAAASAVAGPLGDRGHPRGARRDARDSQAGRPRRGHVRDDGPRAAARLHRRGAPAARPGSQLVVTILSFGFKHGIPVDSDLLFDVRFLPNPHFVPALRPHTGRDAEVVRYLDRSAATHEFLEHTLNLLKFLIPQYVARRKDVPDHRHRLHRRPPPVGRDCRGAQERAVGNHRRAAARQAPGHCE